jgi:hypothetical protein
MAFVYKTECPECGDKSEMGSDQYMPNVSCGDCLMDRVEVVRLRLTLDRREIRR